jgi:hypothetical protein
VPKKLKPDVQLDSHFSHPERERRAWDGSPGYVMGSADGEYGHVSGFRETMRDTGMRNTKSALGRKVIDGE